MYTGPRIEAASDHSLLVTFGNRIDISLHEHVRGLLSALLAEPLAGVLDLHPAYTSLLLDYNPLQISFADLESELRRRLRHGPPPAAPRLLVVPVRYGGEFGPDLELVAEHCRMTEEEIIERHCAPEYVVYFLGFSPGFPYLGGMDPALETPRLASPRKSVSAGSVGIAGNQTGVYPLPSPGGWRIIGRTPLRLFESSRNPPALLEMGDRLRFTPIKD